jgi:hypothetical protein
MIGVRLISENAAQKKGYNTQNNEILEIYLVDYQIDVKYEN